MDDISEIKVVISLGDLTELKDLAGYYKIAAQERDELRTQNIELKKELEKLKGN